MNTRWIYAAVLVTLGNSDRVDASYVIKLKNGNEYVTTRYWSEGKQLLFDAYGGVFGIDSAFISKIEQSERPTPLARETSVQDRKIAEAAAPNEQPISPKDVKPAEKPSPSPSVKEELKKDEAVLKEYGELQSRFGQLNDLPKHEVHALDSDINSFREKLSNSSLAEAHREEIDALRTLQRAIGSYLRAAYP